MQTKNSEPEEMTPISSRMRRSLWLEMKREAFESGIPLQDLLDQACRTLLDSRAKTKKKERT